MHGCVRDFQTSECKISERKVLALLPSKQRRKTYRFNNLFNYLSNVNEHRPVISKKIEGMSTLCPTVLSVGREGVNAEQLCW